MNQQVERQLETYCDLTPSMLTALDHPQRGHPNSLRALEEGGLLTTGKHTDAGRQVLERAHQIVDGTWHAPAQFPITWLDNLHITVARCRKVGLRTVHVKALRHLAHFPGTTWKYLCATYGAETLQVLLERELAEGTPKCSTPWRPTEAGLQVLNSLLP